MIKTKKRSAEQAYPMEEPLKKKTNNKQDPKRQLKKKENFGSKKFSSTDKKASQEKPALKAIGKTFKGDKNGKGKFVGTAKKFSGKPFTATNAIGKTFKGDKNDKGKFFGTAKKFSGKPFTAKKDGEKEPENAGNEKTDWVKFKQDKKNLKLKRKQSKDSYEISVEAKQVYEKLKCRRTEKKNELVEKLYNLLSAGDTIRKVVMAHDTARIIQCMLKFASPSVRDQLSERLLPLAVEMSISKYSHFCVLRMFKYGSPSIKSKLVDSFVGNIVRLACHNISNKILDHVYLTVASAKQKAYMRQEFYGDLYRKAKDDDVKELSDAYKQTPEMKAPILSAVKSNLEHVANKQLVDNSLVHAVMLEYLRECEEDKMEETVSMFAPLIPLMLTTKDGCQAAVICFYKSTPKNRRAIIKTIKEHLVKICTHEHGHIFVLTLLNALDDTKATKKAIYDTIHPELEKLMSNQWGRRVIEWLVSPADTNCFHPTFIASIEEGLKYGKKDKEVRRKEIFEQIEEPIATAIAEKPEFWLSNKHIGLVTADILKRFGTDHFVNAATALAAIVVNPGWNVTVEDDTKEKKSKQNVHDVEKIIAEATKLKKKKQKAAKMSENAEDEKENDDDDVKENDNKEAETPTITAAGIEEAGMHIILKKIIKNDKERLARNADAETFGSILAQQLTDETLKYWLTVNRACFVLLNIVENNNEATIEMLKQLLKPQQAILKKQKTSGAQLLQKKVAF